MKKRVLGLLLISCLLLTAGCGKESDDSSSSKEEKKESTIKTISCSSESESEEIDKDEDGNSIMGIQGELTEYKYDTSKNELVEVTVSSYIEFEDASSDYISKMAEEAKEDCDIFDGEDYIKSCEIKKGSKKLELYLTADVDKLLEVENEDDDENETTITKNSSFEEIEKYVRENSEDESTVCTVK